MSDPSALMAPDTLPGDTFADQAVEVAQYAQEAMNRVAAQYRFAGLVAGVTGPNDTDDDVDAARAAVLEAISEFFMAERGPLRQEIDRLHREYRTESDALEMDLIEHPDFYGVRSLNDLLLSRGHPTDQALGQLEFLGGGDADNHFQERLSRVDLDAATRARLNAQRDRVRQIAQLETQRRAQQQQEFVDFWSGLWGSVRAYYDDKMALIREGRYLVAAGRIVVDGVEVFHAEIIVAIITAAVIAATGGATVAMTPIIAAAVAAALRVVKVGAGVLRRSADQVRHAAAGARFAIELRKVDPDVLGVPVARPAPIYSHEIDVSTDLTPDERRLLNEENQGSTEPTDDAGDPGGVAATRLNQRDADFDEIVGSLTPQTIARAAREGTDDATVAARRQVMAAYEAKFGNTNIMTGMSHLRPVRLVKFPPPERLYTWRNEHAIDPDTGRDRWGYGNFFDPSNGSATPNELGINSVGRTQAELDVSDTPGIAFEGYGAPIEDNWTVQGAGSRFTDGGVKQWHISNDYKPTPDDWVENRLNWRDLPGNEHWVDAEDAGRLVYEDRGSGRPAWYLDGDTVPDGEGSR